MKKYITLLLTLLAIVTCFGIWHHIDAIQQKINIYMSEDVQIAQSDIKSEYIASTSVGVENIPESAQQDHSLGIQVKLYDSSSYENEITNIADYEILDDMKAKNGIQPVNVKIIIKDDIAIYEELHVVVSAKLEKTNI